MLPLLKKSLHNSQLKPIASLKLCLLQSSTARLRAKLGTLGTPLITRAAIITRTSPTIILGTTILVIPGIGQATAITTTLGIELKRRKNQFDPQS